jgi:hypothetical protein
MTGMMMAATLCVLAIGVGFGQTTPRSAAVKAPRTPDGKPDFSGIWQALNTANWNIQDHSARQGPVTALGAAFSVPGGRGIVEGNELPYQPWALEKKRENAQNWLKADPELKCFLPGTPRAMYMPYPFQIAQAPKYFSIVFEFAWATRTAYLDPNDENAKPEGPDDLLGTWMGVSKGRWDGDTLVVDVTNFNEKTWLTARATSTVRICG